ncbi:hypothetical protein [Roseomonas sp. 18066]|uniref:hypothetical protein n=1 Tax=Roseomonas sp. 18066 TaxID=2681412 RepID=UPI0013590ECB|nr:hypothetical protein [Roseomonas sp. 18066]
MRNSMLALTAAALIGLSGAAMAQGTGPGPAAGQPTPGSSMGTTPPAIGPSGANPATTGNPTGTPIPGAAQSGNPGIDRPRVPEATTQGPSGANPPITGQSQSTPTPGPAQSGAPRP